jgi:hypothetical protein
MGMTNLEKTGKHHHYIDVILCDGTYHHFTPRVLDVLLETNRVQRFKRTNGWVTIGVDAVRRDLRSPEYTYQGPDRRRH